MAASKLPPGGTNGRGTGDGPPEPQPMERAERNSDDLDAALQNCRQEHREVLVLREFEQMSYEEMAEALDVPRGTIESRLSRARGELRQILKEYGNVQ